MKKIILLLLMIVLVSCQSNKEEKRPLKPTQGENVNQKKIFPKLETIVIISAIDMIVAAARTVVSVENVNRVAMISTTVSGYLLMSVEKPMRNRAGSYQCFVRLVMFKVKLSSRSKRIWVIQNSFQSCIF